MSLVYWPTLNIKVSLSISFVNKEICDQPLSVSQLVWVIKNFSPYVKLNKMYVLYVHMYIVNERERERKGRREMEGEKRKFNHL